MSRLVFFLAVAMLVVWLVRQRIKGTQRPRSPEQKATPNTTQHMVACLYCHVHLPQSDAVHGQRGDYCCEPHRKQAEG